ncbi:putative ribonuclease H-like domain-containing protein [Tanacetum coccineum]|uniref:Ribonuclease H-like domain-containing protein n=1 Tax=Tanacetum coccineum TaxID=301880 RepID=A0ABQ5ITC0_9ASTR
MTHPHPKRNFVPTAVAIKSGQVPVNAVMQSPPRAGASISTARPVNTATPKPKVKDALPTTYSYFKAYSPVRRDFNQKSAAKTNNFNEKVNTARVNNVTTTGLKAVVSAAKGNRENAIKGFLIVDALDILLETSPSLQIIKKLMVDLLYLEEVLKEVKLPAKKNNVLFTETKCLVLSPDFKLLDESQVLLKVPRHDNMYSFDLKNVVPLGAVNTTCYVQNRCHVTILNTLDPQGKYDGKSDERFLDGYSIYSKSFRVFNTRTRKVEENLHITFLENKPNVTGSGPDCLFDIDLLINSMNYKPVTAWNQTNRNTVANDAGKKITEELANEGESNGQEKEIETSNKKGYANNTNRVSTISQSVSGVGQSFVNDLSTYPLMPDLEDTTDLLNTGIFSGAYDDEDVGAEADLNNFEITMNVSPIPTTRIHKDHPKEQIIGDPLSAPQTRRMTKSAQEHAMIEAMQDELLQFRLQNVWRLVDLPKGKHAIRTKWVYRNKKDERWIVVRNNMDVKSAFLYGTIKEEVYVYQPPGFEDPQFLNKVYKVEKALYGLHQALRAWYETLSTYLLENGFRRGTIDKTLFIKKVKGDILLVQVYVDDIIFGSTKKYLCVEFEQMMHKRFQMSSMGELTFFLRLQVKQKDDRIFISQDKYMVDILKNFDFVTVKTASTPIEINKAFLKDEEVEDIMFAVCAYARFQVTPKVSHLHAVKRIFRYLKGQPKLGLWYPRDSPFDLEAFSDSDYAGASLERKSTTGGCQFLDKRLISWQYKKQTIVANSTTEAEYIVATNCYGQIYDWCDLKMILVVNLELKLLVVRLILLSRIWYCWATVSTARQKLVLLSQKPFNDTYETPKQTQKVFPNMRRKGKGFSGTVTPLFASMLVPHVVKGEGSGQPSEPQPPPSTAPPSQEGKVSAVGDKAVHKELGDRVERAATTATSLDAAQDSGNILKTQSMAIPNVPLSQEISTSGSPRCQESMGSTIAQTRSERVSTSSYDLPLPGGNTPGSDEERFEHHELTNNVPPTPHDSPLRGGHTPRSDEGRLQQENLMDIVTALLQKVEGLESDLKRTKMLYATAFKKLINRVKSLKDELKFQKSKSKRRRLTLVTSEDEEDLVAEDPSKQGRSLIEEMDLDARISLVPPHVEVQGSTFVSTATPQRNTDTTADDLTLAETLMEIRKSAAKDKGKAKIDETESPRKMKQRERVQISRDEEVAQKLQEEFDATERQRMAQVHQAAQGFTNAKWNDVLARVSAVKDFVQQLQAGEKCSEEDLPMTPAQQKDYMSNYIKNQEGGYSIKQLKLLSFEQEVQRLKRAGQQVLEKPVKRQKTKEASGSGEEQSAEKEKELSEEELHKLLVIVLVEELVIQPLQVKDDLVKLWDLVKERFSTTEPTDDKEKELWVELKRLFKPDNDDILWKLQRYMHDPLVWRLYDTCGVHHVTSVRGHDIFMLVEKEYPLTRGTLGLMMVARLLVEADSEMSRELLRKIFYQSNRPRQGGLLGIRAFYNLMLLLQVCAAAKDYKKQSKSLVFTAGTKVTTARRLTTVRRIKMSKEIRIV